MRVASRRKIVNITSVSAVLPPRVFLLGIFGARARPRRARSRVPVRDPPHLAVGKTTHTEHARRRYSTENNKLFSYTTVPCTRYTIRWQRPSCICQGCHWRGAVRPHRPAPLAASRVVTPQASRGHGGGKRKAGIRGRAYGSHESARPNAKRTRGLNLVENVGR